MHHEFSANEDAGVGAEVDLVEARPEGGLVRVGPLGDACFEDEPAGEVVETELRGGQGAVHRETLRCRGVRGEAEQRCRIRFGQVGRAGAGEEAVFPGEEEPAGSFEQVVGVAVGQLLVCRPTAAGRRAAVALLDPAGVVGQVGQRIEQVGARVDPAVGAAARIDRVVGPAQAVVVAANEVVAVDRVQRIRCIENLVHVECRQVGAVVVLLDPVAGVEIVDIVGAVAARADHQPVAGHEDRTHVVGKRRKPVVERLPVARSRVIPSHARAVGRGVEDAVKARHVGHRLRQARTHERPARAAVGAAEQAVVEGAEVQRIVEDRQAVAHRRGLAQGYGRPVDAAVGAAIHQAGIHRGDQRIPLRAQRDDRPGGYGGYGCPLRKGRGSSDQQQTTHKQRRKEEAEQFLSHTAEVNGTSRARPADRRAARPAMLR